ncbi:efflux RND transporter periplasmic adaptor subunit [Pseudemcibacter aquimaris]|uniref:efflux RND transporter periplasmic adaptor subunit n=1 Tax=Pseudemcibacter aquimaris TaxID=2857064 RepID=UPI0020135A88|nr:efflux RND transporter periplasmic adaptor subunit [Pseudemcibacter aquimaris]MCC3860995.1 efflux RND transporter periplasmic adaptor subunit [Pseudemcibacter aquimaris]WDU59813.1 efflux RND transporter periplasmic adaptor subunit [Pseudemcibacter aquimaris]
MRILKKIAPLLVLIAGAVVSVMIINSKEQPQSQEVETKPRNIKAVVAKSGDVELKVLTQGSVRARQVINIVPQVAGQITYVSPKFVAGGKFKEGEVIIRIDPRDYEVAVIAAESQIAESLQRLEEEKAEAALALSEWNELGQGEASDLTLRKPQLARAEAQLKASEASLLTAKLNLERSVIKAPFNGLLTSKNADLGQFLSPGIQIGEYHSTDIREVRLPLSPLDRTKVDLTSLKDGNGQLDVKFTVSIGETTNTWMGKVVRTEGMIVNNTDILWVVAELSGAQLSSIENGELIEIGQFVNAEISGKSLSETVILPRAALNQGSNVMVVDENNALRTQKVTLMDTNRDFIVVSSGVNPGDIINTTQLGAGMDGMLVNATIEEGVN